MRYIGQRAESSGSAGKGNIMIKFSPDTLLARWFVWCCDHFPGTVTREYGNGKPSNGIRRTGAHYIAKGTSLCHIFWAILWVPLMWIAFCSFIVFGVIMLHVHLYRDNSDHLGIFAAFIPEGLLLLVVFLAGTLILAVMGASKVGFLK